MKYRLKKDLPFAKAGTEVEIDSLIVPNRFGGNDLPVVIFSNVVYVADKLRLKMAVDDGWIEEVKPREYKLGLNKDGTFAFIWDSEGNGYDAQRKYPAAETILVREVLE